jgi:hypothetical protein
MGKGQLPNLFQDYWMMQTKLPKQDAPSNKENLSEDWNDFLNAIKKRIEEDI